MLLCMRTTLDIDDQLLTQAKLLACGAGKTLTAVIEDALRARPNCVPIAPGPRHWEVFTGLCRRAGARGNLVPDAYLAALAIESGSEWITADRGFARFPGLRWRHPLD